MIHKSSYPTLAGGINYMLLVYPEEIASALVLNILSSLILGFSFVSHVEPNYLTHILNNLQKHR